MIGELWGGPQDGERFYLSGLASEVQFPFTCGGETIWHRYVMAGVIRDGRRIYRLVPTGAPTQEEPPGEQGALPF